RSSDCWMVRYARLRCTGMKRTASARKTSRTSYVICIKNTDFPESLQLRKVYRRLPQTAADRGWWRIIDEEGEDYLYPSHYFIPVTLSPAIARAVSALPD